MRFTVIVDCPDCLNSPKGKVLCSNCHRRAINLIGTLSVNDSPRPGEIQKEVSLQELAQLLKPLV